MRCHFTIAASAAALCVAALPGQALPGTSPAADSCAAHAPEATSRSGLSVDLLMRVMRAESGGNPRIVSPKGAMGCMQIMPDTWRYLTARYRLDSDPFNARMNMIGGALYLAELSARYGSAGAIAAYNAGPGRYERYLSGSARLPAETIAYAARIGESGPRGPAPLAQIRWQEAGLFLTSRATVGSSKSAAPVDDAAECPVSHPLFPLTRPARAKSESSAAQ